MRLLIAEPIEVEVLAWLSSRHRVRHAPALARHPGALRGALRDAHAAVLPPEVAVDAALLADARALAAVARAGGGTEQIDPAACAARGVEVVRAPVAGAMAEAEFIVGAALQMLRRLPAASGPGIYREGRELSSCTVGIVGMVPAARALAELLGGFGSQVIGYDPSVHGSDPVWGQWRVVPRTLAEVLARADVLAVLLPPATRYRGLLGARLLDRARRGQVIFALGGSAVFDEHALASALHRGTVAAAWLDGGGPGALDPGGPLVAHPHLYLTPRLAASTREAAQRAQWTVARRLDDVLRALPRDEEPADYEDFRATEPGEPLGLEADPATP